MGAAGWTFAEASEVACRHAALPEALARTQYKANHHGSALYVAPLRIAAACGTPSLHSCSIDAATLLMPEQGAMWWR